ncbi:excinuclease ABC subunit UvrC [Zavarzinia sp. CC-PAN008]|uniref:excinuclease ABC subunit UvrC n=1 Tax=Zavarzinia sp. CC-PAN008 TaxID=3243332 RepID=UPI003F743900
MTDERHTPELRGDADDAAPGEGPSVQGREAIRAVLRTLRNDPGVYRMLDGRGEIIYVGKAKNLKKRVTSYANGQAPSTRIARMIAETRGVEVITTGSEVEALLLEANMIKRHRPRYNVVMRDDKSFPYIMIDTAHAWPRIAKHRGARAATAEYFGPFASAGAVNRTLNALQRAFLLRSCTDSMFEARSRPCLLYQIKRCSGPCVDLVARPTYEALVNEARGFLSGESRAVQQRLSKEMEAASADLDFERAAIYRDRIRALTHVQSHQDVNVDSVAEADVFAAFQQGGQTCIQVFFYRAGQNWGNRAYFPKHERGLPEPEVLAAFLAQFYDERPVPRLVLINEPIPEHELLEEALSLKAGRRVAIRHPSRGRKSALIRVAQSNAKEALGRRLAETTTQGRLMEQMAELFELDGSPARVEVYDNSHISGTSAIGAMIVAGPEGFLKNQYRKFNIKGPVAPGDDFAMMKEVLTRRFSRLIAEDPGRETEAWPDLVLIDGGQGQLQVAIDVLEELGIADVPVVGVAKGPDRDAGRERFFRPGRPPMSLEPKSAVLYFLQRLRDEAHRFAIGTHRAKRAKTVTRSALDEVPGIGPNRKRALLHHFGSAAGVARAGVTDLQKVEGISHTVAQAIYDHFHG